MFFERFREALARLPAGLIRPGPPARADALAATEAALGRALPGSFADFLRSFDGVDLFHETVLVAGAGEEAPRPLLALNPERPVGELIFAEANGGDRFAFDAGNRVVRLRSGSDERWLAANDFTLWLDALVAHERVLYGPDGEFSPEAFEADGAEVRPIVALRQTERALRVDPDAAELHHERAVALRRLGRVEEAQEAFRRAAALDPENPWPWFDVGRTALAQGLAGAREALEAFQRAGRLEPGPAGARLWVWGARAARLLALPELIAACCREALDRAPALAVELRRARDAAAEEGDPDELAESEALLAALEDPIATARSRLQVVTTDEPAAPPRRPKPPR